MTTNNDFYSENDNHSDPSSSEEQNKQIINSFRAIVKQPDLAAKDYLTVYKELELEPKEGQEKYLYGIVIEMGKLQGGYDLLTVYTNYCASYIDYTGKTIVWDRSDENFDALIDEVLEEGKVLLPNMPSWDKDYLQPVAKDHMRIHLLSSQGMYSSEGPIKEMSNSPLGEDITEVSNKLMKWLAYHFSQNAAVKS